MKGGFVDRKGTGEIAVLEPSVQNTLLVYISSFPSLSSHRPPFQLAPTTSHEFKRSISASSLSQQKVSPSLPSSVEFEQWLAASASCNPPIVALLVGTE